MSIPYNHGYRDAKNGYPMKLNPYVSHDYKGEWEKGWRDYRNETRGMKDFILTAFFWRKR